MIAQANATLTRVLRQARTETFRDAEEGTDAVLWSGGAPAYYQERRERPSAGGQSESLLVRRSLIVEEEVPAVAWEAELVVEFTGAGGAAQSAVVQNVERRAWAPAGSLQTTRLTLETT